MAVNRAPLATLAVLAADPTRVEHVPADALPALIGEAEALRARLWARLQAASCAPAVAVTAPTVNGGSDRLISAEEVAERLGVDRRWVYRHTGSLPFARRLSGGTLRFSERGLERWKDSRK
jgi:excisionase family DNA binding protein